MIDLHTHTFFSDGELIPSELVCRAKKAGYSAIALTDHVDFSNMDFIIPRIKRVSCQLGRYYNMEVIPGCELSYVPPEVIGRAVRESRKFGAEIVVVHGESPVEPVPEGTNRAAILACCDILAHPGFIQEADVKLAKAKGVMLEITTRQGHRNGNPHVAKLAKKCGAGMVLDTDFHNIGDLLDEGKIKKTLKQAGLTAADFKIMQKNAKKIIRS